MTVSELIQQLKNFPPDALVVTEGYEDGYNTIKKTSVIALEESPNKKWYVGQYTDSQNSEAMQAVFLNAETKADTK